MWANRSQKVAIHLASYLTSPVQVKAWVPWEDGHHENSKMIVLWYFDIFENIVNVFWDFPGGASSKEPACKCRRCKRHGFHPWVQKISWRRAWQPALAFWPWESHGQRSPAGNDPSLPDVTEDPAQHAHQCVHDGSSEAQGWNFSQ